LFGTAIALVLFPTMAERFNAGDILGLKRIATNGLRIIWMLTVPSAAALILLGRQLISLLLERGEFTADSTDLVYGILVFFSLRVVSEATLEIAARLFFAQHNTRTPMFVAMGWMVVNITLAYLLVGPLGVGGLALATSIAFTLQTAVLLYLNHRKLNGLDWKGLGISFGRTAVATLGMSLVILGLGQLIDNTLLFLLAAGLFGLLSYGLLQILLGGREIPDLIALVRGKSTA
jgi:putative peptidoglycan lipid II flippase